MDENNDFSNSDNPGDKVAQPSTGFGTGDFSSASEPKPEAAKDFSSVVNKTKKSKGRLKNWLIFILLAALVLTWVWPYIEESSITGSVIGMFVDDYSTMNGFEDGSPYLGNPNAPVKVIIFSDFQCPYCAKLAEGALIQVREEYVKTGKVKLVFKQMPLAFHDQAEPAAVASLCAGKQDKFWEYHDKLFGNQGKFSKTYFSSLAEEMGLNVDAFNRCSEGTEVRNQINLDKQAASQAEIRGTPAAIINGELVFGAQPFDAFKEVIDRKLAE